VTRPGGSLNLPACCTAIQTRRLAPVLRTGHFSRMSVNAVESAEARAAAAGGAEKRAYVRRIFSQIAPRYDLLNHLLSFNIDKRWRRAALAQLGWQRVPHGVYVDLCAGTLDVSAELARRPGFEGRIVGADFAEPMLRAGAGKAPNSVVSPVVADALDLPLGDDAASGAIVAFGIRNVADLGAALREVRRVLEPGARFVILEFTTPRSRLVRGFYHFYFHHLLPRVGALVSGHRTAYTYLPRSVANFPIEEQLAVHLRAAGFVDVHWRTLTFGIAAIHVGAKP
jgi:demethylmenaquinone methyltransferase / 2-methoxy-6-polyprenyl-1,4-benzoquinol methylase